MFFSVLLPGAQESVWFKHEYVKDRAHAVWWSHKPCQQCLRMHSEALMHRSARQKAVCSFLPFVYNAAIRDLMHSIWEGSSGTCDSTAKDTGRNSHSCTQHSLRRWMPYANENMQSMSQWRSLSVLVARRCVRGKYWRGSVQVEL